MNTRSLYWSVRRELWEHRSIYVAPLAAAAVFLFAFLIGTMTQPGHRMRAILAMDAAQQRAAIEQPYNFASILIMAIAFFVGVFYSLDALYGERRDRSILFWKSLPVSDLTTVLSKASIPLVVLPLLTFAITIVTQGVILLLSTAVVLGSGLSVATLWTQVPLFHMSLPLLYHLVTVHALWHAPIYGWLLLVSVWARRGPFLWATLPLVAIGVVEKMVFNTSHFATMLGNRISGMDAAPARGSVPMNPLTHVDPVHFLSSPGLWIGLAFTVAFLAIAMRLRRYREPI